MKQRVFAFLLVISSLTVFSQNLVPNGSFDRCKKCPGDTTGLFIYVQDWLGMFQPNIQNFYPNPVRTIEYFHKCGKGVSSIDSSDFLGQQSPRTGAGMAGLIFNEWNFGLHFYREWITVLLKDTLEKDSSYCVSFYVRKTNTYTTDFWMKWNMSTNTFSATFTPDTLIGKFPVSQWWPSPQVVYNDTLIRDTARWFRISGSFKAKGNEAYMTIGAGLPDDQISVEPDSIWWNLVYYLVDDVATWKCSAPVYRADAGDDLRICVGDEVSLGTHDYPEYRYYWFKQGNLQDTLSTEALPVFTPQKTTTYVLLVVDFKYDRSWDGILVEVEPDCPGFEMIPNVFTPDSDGYNDLFVPQCTGNTEYRITIYNRWGREVFKGNQDHLWDGNINGVKASEGVYYYVISAYHVISGAKRHFSGSVTVLY